MDNTRVTRTRAKSSSANETAASSGDAEMAPNLNGNKDGGGDDSAGENVIAATADGADSPKEGSTRTARKRKLTDMKSDEEELNSDETSKDNASASDTKDQHDKLDASSDDATEEGSADDEVCTKPELTPADTKTPEPSSPVVEQTPPVLTAISPIATPAVTPVPVAATASDPISNDLQTINTGVEIYGKGKRARVPNKRYSDIIHSSTRSGGKIESPRSTKKPTTAAVTPAKNGDFPEDDLGEILREELEQKEFHTPPRRPATTKKLRSSVDLANPSYRKPFKYGWKRELVYRATLQEGKRLGDIYYITPDGQKVRSMREVAENLNHRELSLEDFTFHKEALGINDPEKEIVREAKKPGSAASLEMNRKMTSKLISKSKKRASSSPAAPAKSAKSSKSSSFKVKVPKGGSTKKDKKDDSEAGMMPPNWNYSKKGGKAGNLKESESKPCRPCSIRCEGVLGLVPTLQCRICLCLYHNECVGISPQVNVQAYVCKNCQLEQEPNTGSGTNLSATSPTAPALSSPAKLPTTPENLTNLTHPPPLSPQADLPVQRLEASTPSNNTITELSPKSVRLKLNNNNTVVHTEQKSSSLVGSLTTWFPASSTIQVAGNHTDGESLDKVPRRPQLVEYIGNKKYLVVPRHNILSVRSPAQGDCASSVILSSTSAEPNEVQNTAFIPPPPPPLPPSTPPGDSPERGPSNEERSKPSDDDDDTDEKMPEPVKAIPSRQSLRTLRDSVEREAPKAGSGPPNFMGTYMQNLQYGYKTLFCVFQYLKVQDLLRAGCVCTMWRDMSRYPLLWRTVRMKNSQIHSFDGLANALQQHGTVHLDLRKMLLPSNTTNDDIWPSFTNAIRKVDSLRRIELCRCLASVVEDLARNNHNLEVINAVTIKCESMTFEPFANLSNLVDLRLKSTAGLTLSSDLSALKALTKLKHLSITSIKDLNKLNIEVISELVNLEVLDLGECSDFPKHFGPDILSKLTKLEKLRLEKGQGECHTFDILEAVKDLKELQQLELVNFDIKTGFDKALGVCSNIKKLLIIPTYISQSATTNHMVLGGVLRLQKTLSHFVWGVTLELLRVTELFVDQCEQPDKKEPREKGVNNGDSIPVLKPVPLLGIQPPEVAPTSDAPQVEILPLPNLQKLLLQNLPTTRVKILKIPFHATWRQSITDSVN